MKTMTLENNKKVQIIAGMIVFSLVAIFSFISFVQIANAQEGDVLDVSALYHEVEIDGEVYLVPKSDAPDTSPALRSYLEREARIRNIGYGYWSGCVFYIRGPSDGSARIVDAGHVRRIIASDRCSNIESIQINVPRGFKDVGGRICQLDNSFHVFCRPAINPVLPGKNVRIIASPLNQSSGQVSYSWKKTGGESLGSTISRDSSSIDIVYEDQGIHQITVTATDSAGNETERICGVTVSNDLRNASGISLDTSPSAFLRGDLGLTNTTCAIEWSGLSVNECFLVEQKGMNEAVELTGERNVEPGTYQLRCISYTDGLDVIESEPFTCRSNLDVREI